MNQFKKILTGNKWQYLNVEIPTENKKTYKNGSAIIHVYKTVNEGKFFYESSNGKRSGKIFNDYKALRSAFKSLQNTTEEEFLNF